MAQKIVRASQSARQRRQHFERDARVAVDEGEKILARQLSQPRIPNHRRVGRAPVAIEHRHLPEKIPGAELSERDGVTIGIGDADAHLSQLDPIHGVARIIGPKNDGGVLAIVDRQELAQLHRGVVIE